MRDWSSNPPPATNLFNHLDRMIESRGRSRETSLNAGPMRSWLRFWLGWDRRFRCRKGEVDEMLLKVVDQHDNFVVIQDAVYRHIHCVVAM